ncbi:MAG: hypothetical protein AMXMBFR49_25860 [Chlorobiota bacterium]
MQVLMILPAKGHLFKIRLYEYSITRFDDGFLKIILKSCDIENRRAVYSGEKPQD